MTFKLAWLAAAALMLRAIGLLHAQASPFDPITRDTVGRGISCYHHARYIVVERPVAEVGSDLFIRPARSHRCAADSLPGDIVLRNHDAEYFLGLRGDLLFIDNGTGPDFRGLILVDLRTQRRLLQTDYVGDVVSGPDAFTVGVWHGYELTQPAAGCPKTDMIPGVDSLFWIDLRSGSTRFAQRTRCAERQ